MLRQDENDGPVFEQSWVFWLQSQETTAQCLEFGLHWFHSSQPCTDANSFCQGPHADKSYEGRNSHSEVSLMALTCFKIPTT